MGRKKLWEKEKLLFMSNFSFSHSVFKTRRHEKKQGLFGKELNNENLTKKMSCREKQCH